MSEGAKEFTADGDPEDEAVKRYPVPKEDEYRARDSDLGTEIVDMMHEREDWLALKNEADQQRQLTTGHLTAATHRIGIFLGFTAAFLVPLVISDGVPDNSPAMIFLFLSFVSAMIGLSIFFLFRAPIGMDINILHEMYLKTDGEVGEKIFRKTVEAIEGLKRRLDFMTAVSWVQMVTMVLGIVLMVV